MLVSAGNSQWSKSKNITKTRGRTKRASHAASWHGLRARTHQLLFQDAEKKPKQKKTLHECIRGPNNTRRSQTMHVSLPLRHSATVKNNAIKRKRPSDCICLSLPAGLLLPFFAFLTWHGWYFQTCSAVSCAYAKIPNTECIRQSLQCNTNRPIHQGFFAR